MNNNVIFFMLCVMAALLQQTAQATDVTTVNLTITGNQERPRVISVVSWQAAQDPDYIGKDIIGLGDLSNGADVLQPLDKTAFNRERRYISSMRQAVKK